MDAKKRKALEAAGWKFGDAADFLEMTAEERQLLDVRVSIARAIRRQRQALNLSQTELGERLKTSQPRVAKIERAAADVSLDQLLRAYTAAGGRIVVKSRSGNSTERRAKRSAASGTLILDVSGRP
jgi:ribosome-binding protein aMBF1 (putative translation factor)